MNAVLENFCVVLHEPRYPENIGAAARCCRNMGIYKLAAVRPRRMDREKMLMMATHEAADLIENMAIHDSLEGALSPFQYAVGTTARTGRQRRPTETPGELAARLVDLSANNRIALVFGSENRGLSNDHLRLCQSVVSIPTSSFSSINLAQSVMIICYEIFTASVPTVLEHPRRADLMELEGMYSQLQEVFDAAGFVKQGNPRYWINQARKFFGRTDITPRDVKLIRSFCRKVLWALNR